MLMGLYLGATMNLLTQDNLPDFLARFFSFDDGFIQKVEHTYEISGKKVTSVWACVKDRDSTTSKIVLVRVDDVSEMVFRESGWSLRVMNMGISVHWFEGMVWIAFHPYSMVMKDVEDYRNSNFMVAGRSCYWREEREEKEEKKTARQENVFIERSNTRPPGLGVSFFVEPGKLQPTELLARLREVWAVVAEWGRWSDEDLRERPFQEQCMAALPAWFAASLQSVPASEIQDWLQNLHERRWVWWSGAVINGDVRIDLSAERMPASFWMLDFVVEKLGGKVTHRGYWGQLKGSGSIYWQ